MRVATSAPHMSGSAWVKGSHLTLVRNPQYFRAAEGLPRVDQITFRFGLDAAAILDELKAGRCNIAGDDVAWGDLASALLAVFLWVLVLLGVNLHVHGG